MGQGHCRVGVLGLVSGLTNPAVPISLFSRHVRPPRQPCVSPTFLFTEIPVIASLPLSENRTSLAGILRVNKLPTPCSSKGMITVRILHFLPSAPLLSRLLSRGIAVYIVFADVSLSL